MNQQQPQAPNPELSGIGYLIVKVATAGGAVPIERASVIVRGSELESSGVLLSFLTDRDGLTPKVQLPTVARADSQAPSPAQKPFATYNIDVIAKGYYPQYYQNVPIFDGITAVQNANIIPLSEGGEKNPYVTEEQIFDEYQNPNL